MKHLGFIFLMLGCTACHASEWQSLSAIQTAAEAFVQEKVAAQPGQYTVSVSRVDSRLKLARCDQLEAFQAAGSHLWGNTSVGVRCLSPAPWSITVPVTIKVSNNVLVVVRPLANGQQLQAEDVQLQQRDITAMAGSALTAPSQAIDKLVNAPIASGTILRAEMLRIADIIQQGQTVKLVAQGSGFRVTSEGQAMGNAKAGQVVSVKTRSGQLIKGIAKAGGMVEVYF